jgi:hypothetical protein
MTDKYTFEQIMDALKISEEQGFTPLEMNKYRQHATMDIIAQLGAEVLRLRTELAEIRMEIDSGRKICVTKKRKR